MCLHVSKSPGPVTGEISITGSKSESNRLLVLQALYPDIEIKNLSDSDDTHVLKKALLSGKTHIDIHHAGTAMRFLTAYFAATEGREVLLTGSERMRQRPIKLLVDALRQMGGEIDYLEEEGFPPLRIKGKKLPEKKVVVNANISSQYISALVLIAPSLPHGLEICLEGPVTSVPYIDMSLSLLKQAGFSASFEGKKITVEPKENIPKMTFTVESDWSSASYFYSIAALSEQAEIRISSYKEKSLQGDNVVAQIYSQLGVETMFLNNEVVLKKNSVKKPRKLVLDLTNSPDLAQTIAVTCFALKIPCELHGLHTLKIKETDRLQALKNEIEKLGGEARITSDSIKVFESKDLRKDIKIETYNDHRMAMAFAPLALKVPMRIADAGVVSKSYPGFWEDLRKLGFSVVESEDGMIL